MLHYYNDGSIFDKKLILDSELNEERIDFTVFFFYFMSVYPISTRKSTYSHLKHQR